jgi:CHAT domain-containing protein
MYIRDVLEDKKEDKIVNCVCLSICNTSCQYKAWNNDGIDGFVTSLFYNPKICSVIASLLPVKDMGSALFWKKFYGDLKSSEYKLDPFFNVIEKLKKSSNGREQSPQFW